jgi:CheY-like chemotaxis protein
MTKKTLFIDDDEDEMDIFAEALDMASIKCDCSGDQALAALDSVSPDIIFIDVNMPGMNGLECLKNIRKRTGCINTPVVIYSTVLTAKQ